jgi:hypothetical protein
MYRTTAQEGSQLMFSHGSNKDYGSNPTVLALTPQSGSDAVQLPDDAVGSSEVLDEPGVARDRRDDVNGIPPQSSLVVASRSIDCPADGFVLAIGEAEIKQVSLTALFAVDPGVHSIQLIATDPFANEEFNVTSTALTLIYLTTSYGTVDVE